jgi:hypothetical protein
VWTDFFNKKLKSVGLAKNRQITVCCDLAHSAKKQKAQPQRELRGL